MAHSDDQGLILPPRLAPVQVVIVPIYRSDEDRARVLTACDSMIAEIATVDPSLRVHLDKREGHKPGFKFNEWELKGVPLRIELGPKDLEKDQVCVAARFGGDGKKEFLPARETLAALPARLEDMQRALFDRALAYRRERTAQIDTEKDFADFFAGAGAGFAMAHWCGDVECEDGLAERYRTSIRVIPIGEVQDLVEDGACLVCGRGSRRRVVMAQAY
jgi:prolyl-tRNA synthetase